MKDLLTNIKKKSLQRPLWYTIHQIYRGNTGSAVDTIFLTFWSCTENSFCIFFFLIISFLGDETYHKTQEGVCKVHES